MVAVAVEGVDMSHRARKRKLQDCGLGCGSEVTERDTKGRFRGVEA